MSIEESYAFMGEHAKNSLFEVTLFDENDSPMKWTTGLIQGIEPPSISFEVGAHEADTVKGYDGWQMPEDLSLTIYETVDRKVEKYLLDWSFGNNGIYNWDKGMFRKTDKYSHLYRLVEFRTFTYSVKEAPNTEVIQIEIEKELENLKKAIQKVNNLEFKYTNFEPHKASKEIITEYTSPHSANFLNKVGLPLSGITHGVKTILNSNFNKAIGMLDKKSKGMASYTKSKIDNTIIMPKGLGASQLRGFNQSTKPIKEKLVKTTIKLPEHKKIDNGLKIETKQINNHSPSPIDKNIQETATLIANRLRKLPKSTYSEVGTSTRLFRVALSSYDVGTYSYGEGEPISYNLSLPIVEYNIPTFAKS